MSDPRIPAGKAGYMELRGAVKNGDCRKVAVPNGVSKEKGCCNEFEPKDNDVDRFRCGDCHYALAKRGLAARLAKLAKA